MAVVVEAVVVVVAGATVEISPLNYLRDCTVCEVIQVDGNSQPSHVQFIAGVPRRAPSPWTPPPAPAPPKNPPLAEPGPLGWGGPGLVGWAVG